MPNVIVFDIDTLRTDHLGCAGYFRDTSPTIDRLAREGVFFPDMHASGVATGPGQTSMVTGLAPISHHFYLTPFNLPNLIDFDDDIPTLAELVQDVVGDMTTATFDNLINFKSHMDQFVRGYEYYVNCSRTAQPIHHHLVGGDLNKRLVPWIAAHADESFFLWVHYWDPHTPYNQPDAYRDLWPTPRGNHASLPHKRAGAGYDYVPGWGAEGQLWDPPDEPDANTIELYDGEIRYTDDLLAEVLGEVERQGLSDETVVVVTSDHGEQLGQHGMYGHAMLHEAVVQVPLVLWGPGVLPSGRVVPGYAQHADIAPTILDILGADPAQLPRFDGESLLPAIRAEADLRDEMLIEGGTWRALVRDGFKFIRGHLADVPELYDLANDPMEIINLADAEPERCAAMRRGLAQRVRQALGDQPDPLFSQLAHEVQAWDLALGRVWPSLTWQVPSQRGQ